MSTSSEAKAVIAKQRLGVEHTFDYRDAQWAKEIRRVTQGHGVDVVVEVAGGRCLAASIQACGYGGRVAVIGVLGGLSSRIDIRQLLMHQVTVRGIFMESTEQLHALVRAVAAMGIGPQIDRVFSFQDTPGAYEYLRSGRHFGKVVIDVRPDHGR